MKGSEGSEAVRKSQSDSNMKGAFVAVLMVPVLVALLVGIYVSTQDLSQGLPLLLGGVVLGVFNFFVLRYLFARLAKMEQEDAAKASEGGSADV